MPLAPHPPAVISSDNDGLGPLAAHPVRLRVLLDGDVQPEDLAAGLDEPLSGCDARQVSLYGPGPHGCLEGVEAVDLDLPEHVDSVRFTTSQGLLDDLVDGAAVGIAQLLGDVIELPSGHSQLDGPGAPPRRQGAVTVLATAERHRWIRCCAAGQRGGRPQHSRRHVPIVVPHSLKSTSNRVSALDRPGR